jgi:hypothetical protein
MATRVRLSGLSIPLPEDWEDHTLVTLVGPPLPGLGMRRARMDTAERPTVAIKRERVDRAQVPLDTFAAAQEALIARIAPGMTVVDRGSESLLGGITALRREFALPGTDGRQGTRQLQLYFYVGDEFFAFSGTGPDDVRFDRLRAQFLEIANGLLWDEPQCS